MQFLCTVVPLLHPHCNNMGVYGLFVPPGKTNSHMQDVCDFCNQHLEANQEAFADPKLKLIYDDAKAQLQQVEGQFDVIIADLADPVYGGPCYQVSICTVLSPCTLLGPCTAATMAAAQAICIPNDGEGCFQ